ncbi:hypothetical protein E2C01_065356 [Portunus trituberculatus]|uniref:Uncharacterized protein n=1 Tax=Portunus trituberculatus TaxID=210409 RepID=A0A5B7HPC8_PORTR|nr:hypothetical protein [Portunus trituberculatus]
MATLNAYLYACLRRLPGMRCHGYMACRDKEAYRHQYFLETLTVRGVLGVRKPRPYTRHATLIIVT